MTPLQILKSGHLGLQETSEYDNLIRRTLERRLVLENDVHTWPHGMNSALIWWDVYPEYWKPFNRCKHRANASTSNWMLVPPSCP